MAGRRPRPAQRGAALLIFLILFVTAALSFVVTRLNPEATEARRAQKTQAALAQAREALIGRVVTTATATAGYLSLPDLGPPHSSQEGTASLNFAGNAGLRPVAGRLPWRTLGIGPLRDGAGECLWYVVAGRFKNQPWGTPPVNSPLNWDDTLAGRIRLVDAAGNLVADELAALVVAPGRRRDGQNRASDASAPLCGGNYDVRNYLDPYHAGDAISGALNYFPGSINHRVAADSSEKTLVMAATDHYNDRMIAVSAAAVFAATLRANLADLLDDPHFAVAGIGGPKGTDGIDCATGIAALPPSRRTLCRNWKEMLLLTGIDPPAPVTIDGVATGNCSRVLIFGGRRTATQQRAAAADKADPANYLEAPNLAAFAVPQAISAGFSGAGRFDAAAPSADVIKCIP